MMNKLLIVLGIIALISVYYASYKLCGVILFSKSAPVQADKNENKDTLRTYKEELKYFFGDSSKDTLRTYKEELKYFFGDSSNQILLGYNTGYRYGGLVDVFHVNNTCYVVKKGLYKDINDFTSYLIENNLLSK